VDEGEDLQLGFTTDPFFCGEATKPPPMFRQRQKKRKQKTASMKRFLI
jgi:hypothetical protein